MNGGDWIGRTIAHYRIVSALGQGGMGEVYLAEDDRLHRRVALKMLRAADVGTAERHQRFTQEARAIAALSHPNIVTVYAIEEADGVPFLAMELVDGQTLQSLIPKDGMPVTKLVEIAIPLADAVAAAHAHGITHRDLKPGNVMITADGRLKVLDFGLAKLHESASSFNIAETRTAAQLTNQGQIVGTVNYMSPEQAEGRAVDHRTDIFSLGVILYELATGERPFKGETALSTLSAILRDEPRPLSDARPDLPRDFLQIVRKCLAKDPERRYQSAKDLRNDLDDLRVSLQSGALDSAVSVQSRPATRSRAGWVAGLVAVVALIVIVVILWVVWPREAPAPVWRAMRLTSDPGLEMYPALSPDGRSIAYVGGAGTQTGDIFIKSVGGSNAINLTAGSGTRNSEPAFSPDGERIAFVSNREGGGIYVMGRQGDSLRRLTNFGSHPSWAPDGLSIVFCVNGQDLPLERTPSDQLWVVDVATTTTRRIEGAFADVMHPRWSPDNTRIAYWGMASGGNREVWTVAITGGSPVRVTDHPSIDWDPVWSPDGQSLYFLSDRSGTMQIWNVNIDSHTGRSSSEPRLLTTPAPFVAHLYLSADGQRLTYLAYERLSNIVRYAFNPVAGEIVGSPVAITSGTRAWNFPAVSPDGGMVAFTSSGSQEDVYVAKADGSGLTQLTNDAAIDRVPQWSPDGRTIAYYSQSSGRYQAWTVQPDGLGRIQRTESPDGISIFGSVWSPDGRALAVAQTAGPGLTPAATLFQIDAAARGEIPTRELPGGTGFFPNSWSADGQWIAGYTVRLVPVAFNLATREQRMLGRQGSAAVWLPDSRRLVYGSSEGLMLVDVVTGESRRIGPPTPWVSLSVDGKWLALVDRRDEGDIWMMTKESR